jgi:hypothetical protein
VNQPTIVRPTVGRIVWVRREQSEDTSQPEAAQIVYVHSNTSINVVGHDKDGNYFFIAHLYLNQDGGEMERPFAEWMPYQKQVAAGEIPPVKHVI